jgi:hypothetical protein
VDAFLCMAMDCIIMGQFVRYSKPAPGKAAVCGGVQGAPPAGRAGGLREPLLAGGAV